MTIDPQQAAHRPAHFTLPTRSRGQAFQVRPQPLSFAVSLALASLVASNAAMAQQAQSPAAPAAQAQTEQQAEAPHDGKVTQVKVVATRASQQSSIERKKNAATAIDSIVAEDVGSLPDRNVGEAISRMSGIALDRGDFGEGVSVAVRGNGPDLTRVELDGQGVQSAGGTDQAGGGSGRGVEFRQLSADLIKSVDVVKGSTADMTEGSLGGGIRIQTRSGLDFKKPFASLRLGSSQSSLNKKWEPDANLILADKFMNGRLGLLGNASTTTMSNEAHSVQPSNAGRAGYSRLADFDNSSEKTFSFNPATMNQADANTTAPMVQSPLIAGGFFNSATPLDVLTRSAAAKTKADCYAAFPTLTPEQSAAIVSANRGAAQAQRINELTTCLNQWSDYTPSNIRSFVKRERDKRQNLDLRADFKVNDQLTVYAKGSYNRRYNDMHQLTYSLGSVRVNPTGANAVYSPTYNGPAFIDNLPANTRVPAPGSGYYLYDSPSMASNTYLNGSVANIVPGSIVSDASHHLTRFTISDAGAVTDQTREYAKTIAKYLQLGGTYKNGGLTAEFFAGLATSDFEREQKRVAFTNYYGPVTMSVLPNGLWGYEAPAGSNFNQADPSQYSQAYPGAATGAVKTSPTNTRPAPAYTAAQQPLLTQQSSTYYNPRLMESEERTAKLDLTYRTRDNIPFFTRFKSGFNLRDNIRKSWDPNSGNSGGYTVKDAIGAFGTPGYVPAVVLPTPIIRSTFNGCQDTPGSLGVGGNACQFGFVPSADPRHGLNGNTTLTLQQYQAMLAQALRGQATSTGFFSGAKDRPDALIQNWTELDVNKIFEIVNTPNLNFNCVKECVASDGNVYQQPFQHLKERTSAFYIMGDFKFDHIPFTDRALPFGFELEGNVGYRYVRTKVSGTGMMTLSSVAIIPGVYDPLRPSAPGGVIESAISQAVAIDETSNDHLPSLNLALWMVPDQFVVRYSGAKTVARPPVTYLLPSGNCKYDETLYDRDPNATQRCSGTIGNPALQAQMNFNQNLSAEWYPNRDTMFSLAYFKQDGKIGPAISQGVNRLPLAGGGALVDPVTGVALSDIDFDYSVWQNGAATSRKGFEFGTKTAFTFLPWFLRYTGFDANYTKLRSATSSENVVDLLSGEPLPVARESAYSYNAALWYDDGRFTARVAVQAVASYFNCLAGCGSQDAYNYPAAGVTTGMVRFPYNPGSPNFKDATRFIDAKIAYRWKPNIEFFVEGRNLGNATTSSSQGKYATFTDGTPSLLDYAYAGRRIMVGVNFRTM